ncbi:MAG: T9SS type A sorting domain-containing protein [Crocinitomicaceae bacterium]|nr:T9SS type A sorting domain-containing protein [Crocinitomicaceae bacterium]
MKYLLIVVSLISFNLQAQEFTIVECPDTVYVNSNVPCWGTFITFSNNSQNFVITAIIDTASQQLNGTSQVVGFNGCNTPLPGQPDLLGVEGNDTLFAMFTYFPNGQIGTTVVDVCFFNWNNPGDTICETMVIITDPFASQEKFEKHEISLFPNPTNGQFSISGIENVSENANIYVYNSIGELVFYDHLKSSIYLNDLKGGNYFVVIQVGQKLYTETLVISG